MVRCTAKANANYVGLTEDVVLGEKNNDETFNSGRLTVQKDDKGNAITMVNCKLNLNNHNQETHSLA